MPQPFRQESFAGGEISPRARSRTALAKYGVGLRRARNVIPTPEGALLNRPGTNLVREAKDSAAAVDRPIRLIPFVFSESPGQAYLLEFGHLYVRFHVGGATVADPILPANPYEVVSPYTAADLARLKFAQQGDVLTLARGGYVERELVRNGHTDWAFRTLDFDVPLPSGPGVYLDVSVLDLAADGTHPAKQWSFRYTELWRGQEGVEWETAPFIVDSVAVQDQDQWHAKFTYPVGAKAYKAAVLYRSLLAANLNHDPAALGIWWVVDGLAQIPPNLYTNPAPQELVLYPDRIVKLFAPAQFGLTVNDGSFMFGRGVYRGRGELFGYVGDMLLDLTFNDPGDLPDIARTPPQGRNPFKVFDETGALVRTEHAKVVTFADQRRVFFDTDERPAFGFFSRTGDYGNFDHHQPKLADDAFELELAGRLREEIRWAVGLDQILVGTQSSVWAIRSTQGSVVGPGAMEAKLQSAAGASWLDPILVPPDVVLYVRTKGCGLRDLVYDDGRGKFVGSDLVVLARHLFTGYSIVDAAYAEDPFSVIWLVRSDGKLLSLTYQREQEVWAWAWHDTDGLVENVCTLPEGTEDAVYLCVKRQQGDGTWHRFIERMRSRTIPRTRSGRADPRFGLFLDCATTLDQRHVGPVGDVTVNEIAGGGYGEGASVEVVAHSFAYGSTIGPGWEVALDPEADLPIRLAVLVRVDATHLTCEVLVPVPVAFQATATVNWAMPRPNAASLQHLEGRTVTALVDGTPVDGLVVVGGEVALPMAGTIIHAGLPFVSEAELLPLVVQGREARTKVKNVARVVLELEESLGVEVAERVADSLGAPTPDADWNPWDQREVDEVSGRPQLFTGEVELTAISTWNRGGIAAVRQRQPLPFTLLAATREVDVGG